MGKSLNQCCAPGCGALVPPELQIEGFCVSHYLSSAEKACGEIRRQTAAADSNTARWAEFESYVAASAVKLAVIGTGSVRLSDEIKKRVLTTFHTLMLLRENLDRAANPPLLRPRTATEPTPLSPADRI